MVVSFFSSEFNSSLAYPHFTSLVKPTELHSCELFHTFLEAGRFLRHLLYFALHARFHWYLSISDNTYQIKYNQQFLLSVTLALSNPYCLVYCHHPNLLPVFLLFYSHSLIHAPCPLSDIFFCKIYPCFSFDLSKNITFNPMRVKCSTYSQHLEIPHPS